MTTFHASGANDDYRMAILDLSWRKQEMVALSHARPAGKQEKGDDASTRQGVLESSAAINAAIEICQWGHETESLSVFGVRLGHQVLTSVAVVTAGQVALFSQLILRHYGMGEAVSEDL